MNLEMEYLEEISGMFCCEDSAGSSKTAEKDSS